MTVPRRHLPGGILGKTIIPVEFVLLWQIASALTTPAGPARVAPPGVTGSQPFPEATVVDGEEDAGNPIGSKKALVQTNVTTAKALMAPVGPVRVAISGVTGPQPFPQATEEGREENAGNPIGSKKALVQTDVATAKTLIGASPVVGAKTRAWRAPRPPRARAPPPPAPPRPPRPPPPARALPPARCLTELLRNGTFRLSTSTPALPLSNTHTRRAYSRLREFHPLELTLARAAPYHGGQPDHLFGQ
jgi:hypothetical protein